MNEYYVYILSSKRNGTLYIGVTNDLIRRVYEHRNGNVAGFTRDYGVNRLVHYEKCGDVREAITREKQLKNWRRRWKVDLIQQENPDWKDLYDDIIGPMDSGSSPE
ncbi:MAG: GIY-YIG nuclease family protein [Dehalococcoidia bacterium]